MRKAGLAGPPDMLQGIGNHLHDAGAPTRLVFCKDNMRLSKTIASTDDRAHRTCLLSRVWECDCETCG